MQKLYAALGVTDVLELHADASACTSSEVSLELPCISKSSSRSFVCMLRDPKHGCDMCEKRNAPEHLNVAMPPEDHANEALLCIVL